MSNKAASSGFPIIGILGLIFITLKLTGVGVVANWSWWLVLAPFWVGAAIAAFILIVFFFAIVIREARSQSRR